MAYRHPLLEPFYGGLRGRYQWFALMRLPFTSTIVDHSCDLPAAEEKLRWVRRSHRWLLLSFVAVLGLLVLLAFFPAAPDAGPTQIILLTPTPHPLPKP